MKHLSPDQKKRVLATLATIILSCVVPSEVVSGPFAQEAVSDELLDLIDIAPPSVTTGEYTSAPLDRGPRGLVIKINRVRNDIGVVSILIYDDANAFARGDYSRAVGYAEVKAAAGLVRADFPDLIHGPYAVFVFHDENGDADFTMQGRYPQEGYGHSNSRGAFEAPPFDIAAVSPGTVKIRMHYVPVRSDWEHLQEEMRR